MQLRHSRILLADLSLCECYRGQYPRERRSAARCQKRITSRQYSRSRVRSLLICLSVGTISSPSIFYTVATRDKENILRSRARVFSYLKFQQKHILCRNEYSGENIKKKKEDKERRENGAKATKRGPLQFFNDRVAMSRRV